MFAKQLGGRSQAGGVPLSVPQMALMRHALAALQGKDCAYAKRARKGIATSTQVPRKQARCCAPSLGAPGLRCAGMPLDLRTVRFTLTVGKLTKLSSIGSGNALHGVKYAASRG